MEAIDLDLERALAENAKALDAARKVNWREGIPRRGRVAASFRTIAKTAHATGFYRKYVSDFGPNVAEAVSRAKNVVAITQQVAHVGAALEANGSCRVHWIVPEKMIDVAFYAHMHASWRKRVTLHLRSVFDPLPDELAGVPIDFLVLDSNHASRQFHAALLSCPAASEALAKRPGAAYVYGRVPLPGAGNLLTAAWETWFATASKTSGSLHVKPATARPHEFNWSVSISNPAATSTTRKTLGSLFSRTMVDPGPVWPAKMGAELARRVCDALRNETIAMKSLAKGRAKLPKCRWDTDYTAYRNRSRPWTPAIHCSKAAALNDVSEFVKGADYVLDGRDSGPSTHAGQLKLLVSEAEFLLTLRRSGSLKRDAVVVVYVGASPGTHLKYLVGEFEEVSKWILYDSAASDARSLPRVDFRRRYFRDDELPALRRELEGCFVVYVSDIRTTIDEAEIREDMVAQARWGVCLGADAMLLKFRLPYVDEDGNHESLAESKSEFHAPGVPKPRLTSDSEAGAPSWSARRSVFPLGSPGLDAENDACPPVQCFDLCRSGRGLLYLDGSVVTQVFAPSTSTETRLVVFKSGSGSYNLTRWNPRSYESCMNSFNEGLRRTPDASMWFPGLGVPAAVGTDDTYDCCRARSSLAEIGVDLGKEFGETLLKKAAAIAKPPRMTRDEREMHSLWERSQRVTVSDHERVMAMRALAASSRRKTPVAGKARTAV
jgi:hypothetical protein